MKSNTKGDFRWTRVWHGEDQEHTGEVIDGLDGDGGTTGIYPIMGGLWFRDWRRESGQGRLLFVFTGDGP